MRRWFVSLVLGLCLAPGLVLAQAPSDEMESDGTIIRIQPANATTVEVDFVKRKGDPIVYQMPPDAWQQFLALFRKAAHQEGYTGDDTSMSHRYQQDLGQVQGLHVWYYQDSALGDSVVLTDGRRTVAELNNLKSEEFLRHADRVTQRMKNDASASPATP